MFEDRSRGNKSQNLHFPSYFADRSDRNPVGFGQSGLGQTGLQQSFEVSHRESLDKAVPASTRPARPKALDRRQRLTPQPYGRMGLSYPQFQIGVGHLNAGTQENALAPTLRRGGPDRFQHFLRLPEVTGVVQRDTVAERGMARRHEAKELRGHQRLGL